MLPEGVEPDGRGVARLVEGVFFRRVELASRGVTTNVSTRSAGGCKELAKEVGVPLLPGSVEREVLAWFWRRSSIRGDFFLRGLGEGPIEAPNKVVGVPATARGGVGAGRARTRGRERAITGSWAS